MDKKRGWYNMGNLSSDARKTLPEFQEFLVKKSLAPEKNVPFLAYWVSRFLEYARKHDIAATEYQETAMTFELSGNLSATLLQTTMIYTNAAPRNIPSVLSPLDK